MATISTWIIALFAIAGVLTRPWKTPEALWAVLGAILLVLCGLLTPAEGWQGVSKGFDVYLFLTGMMLLSETAREEKVFDWLAAHATRLAGGSAGKLFLLIYGVGIAVTALLSNDATAVVLTPAVAASVKAARARQPLPYLLICAFIANAASFILPISNPANLVLYGSHLPPLLAWLQRYALPSVLSVGVTYFLLRFTQRKALQQEIQTDIPLERLTPGGRTALWGIGVTAIILLVASALDSPLGLPTAITGLLTSAIVLIRVRKRPRQIIRGVSWSVLPLVAGLFVIVEALAKTGAIRALSEALTRTAAHSVPGAAWLSGLAIAFGSNLMNNLPAGLIAAGAIQTGHVPEVVRSAILIGVDLGPNLSITGSLATILWLTALRREGQAVSAWTFLKIGIWVMTVALLCALAALIIL